jgi:patatin-like phospholipase/acyl hydrolase
MGLGMRPREIVQFYVNQGPRIFKNRCGWRSLLQWVCRKFPQKPLMEGLRDEGAFGDKLLGHSRKRLVIPTYNLGADKVRVFKTPHHERLKTDWQIPAWKVALATSAAPTYFPACRHIEKTRLVDGGVWANNPAMVGVIEAMTLLGADAEGIKVFSIGTTDSRKHRRKALDSGGILQWLRKSDVLDVLMRGQSVGINGQMQLLLGDRFRRIDPVVPDGIYHLDKVTPDELLAEAEDAALHFSPTFEEDFAGHTAQAFEPLYPKNNKDA